MCTSSVFFENQHLKERFLIISNEGPCLKCWPGSTQKFCTPWCGDLWFVGPSNSFRYEFDLFKQLTWHAPSTKDHFFFTKDYFTVSCKPQPPHPHPICCLHKFWWDSLFSTPQLATHNDWKASKHWNAFSSCATWGTWIMQPFKSHARDPPRSSNARWLGRLGGYLSP